MDEPRTSVGIESRPLGSADPGQPVARVRTETQARREKLPQEDRVAQSVAPKRILLIHRWFWPDAPPYASMLRSIGRRLVQQGYAVTVLTAQPSYNAATRKDRRPETEELDGMTVVRVPQFPESKRNWVMRGINMLLFMRSIRRHVLRQAKTDLGAFDAIMASTMPPVLVAATARRAARKTGARFLYHMMDIYPEIAWASGMARRSPLTRWLAKVDARNCAQAARVIVLSTDMRDSLAARGLETDNVVLLNNFRLESFEDVDGADEKPAARNLPPSKRTGNLRMLFAGNLGRFQGLSEVVEVVRGMLPENQELELHFLGDGVRRKELEAAAGDFLDQGIFFHGHVSPEEASAWTRSADVSLITLQPGIIRYAFPSKTMTCLCEGSAILAMVEMESALGRMVLKERVGRVAKSGEREDFAKQVRRFLAQPEATTRMAVRSEALGRERFLPEVVLPGWVRLFKEIL